MDWIDATVPIRTGMVVYRGDPEVRIERVQDIAQGALCNVSRAELGVHTGTHIDAPVHFIEGAGGIDAIDVERLVGEAYVVDATGVQDNLDAAALATLSIPAGARRLLFKTSNSNLWARERFSPGFVAFAVDGAEALVARGAEVVGIDYFSVAPAEDPAATHLVLLRAGIVIVEGLDLRRVQPGWHDFICLPLLITGSDGAPARALLRPRDNPA